MEKDVALVRGGEHGGELGLSAIRGETRRADAAFLVGIRVADQCALSAATRIEMATVQGIA
jgi:hypothetical protein